jgi:hypothetical protein
MKQATFPQDSAGFAELILRCYPKQTPVYAGDKEPDRKVSESRFGKAVEHVHPGLRVSAEDLRNFRHFRNFCFMLAAFNVQTLLVDLVPQRPYAFTAVREILARAGLTARAGDSTLMREFFSRAHPGGDCETLASFLMTNWGPEPSA